MVIWGLGVNNIENVIKPLIISKGSDMPFLLIFFGVLGGALAFGFIGIFLGPTLLAVGYQVVKKWGEAAALPNQTSLTREQDSKGVVPTLGDITTTGPRS